jgi:hypothetical protein
MNLDHTLQYFSVVVAELKKRAQAQRQRLNGELATDFL